MRTLALGLRGIRGRSFRVAAIGAAAFLLLSLIVPIQTIPVARAATEWYVAPGISSGSGNGSQGSPWNIQFALNGASGAIQPGDTIWLRGGTYTGCLNSWLSGTSSAPIWVKQYSNERAKLDSGSVCNGTVLNIQGSYTNFMGFEVTNSYTGWPVGDNYGGAPTGININDSSNIKLINLIVHDMNGQGIGAWAGNNTAEIHGSLIYYNGQMDHDHGIYIQNTNGTKRVTDNFLFNEASHGIHGYGSGELDNLYFEGNTAFNNGMLGPNDPSRNFLVGGGISARNLVFNNNNAYFPASVFGGDAINLGYSAGCTNATVNNNYSYGSDVNLVNCQISSMTGNQFYAREFAGFNPNSYPGNTFQAAIPAPKPSTNRVVVRPNQYESGRANITIYNWQNLTTVSVPVSGILSSGDTYQLRNVQNYFSDIITGTYNGSGSISVPMTGRTVAKPLLYSAPASSFPEFGGFVLIKTGNTPTPPPPPAPTPVPPPPAPTPVPPPPPAGPAYVYMEAESGSLVSPMTIGSDANAFSGQYVTTPTTDSGSDTITFNAPSAGNYVIWGRVLAPDSVLDSTYVSVDNGTEQIYDMAEGTWSGSWQWSQVRQRLNNNPATLQQRVFNLSAGSHTVKFRGREAGSKLDRVLITNDLSFVPTASPTPTPPPPPAPTPVPPPPTNQPVEGNFDEITSAGVMRGWTLDRNSSSASTQFHVYLNGPAGQGGTLIGSGTANVPRSDVNQVLGVTGNHGFEFSIPSQYRNGATHSAYVYGIDLNDSAGNRLLNGSPRSFNIPTTPPPTPPPAPTPTPTPVPPPGCATVNTGSFFGCYYQGLNFETLKLTRTDNTVNFNWAAGSPDTSLPVDIFSARWAGNFTFESGDYEFSATADDGVRVYVDNVLVIDQWRDQSATTYRVTRNMTAGSHQVRMEYYERTGSAVAQLAWQKLGSMPPPPGPTGTGLTGAYYNNSNFGAHVVTRTDATVNFNWGTGTPDSRIAPDTFSVRWTGQVQPQYSQTHTFYVTSDDGVRLWVNNQLVINNWTDHPPTENSGTIPLVGGNKYDIKLEYYEKTGGAVAQLAWSSSSQPKQIIPQARLYPGTVAGESTEVSSNMSSPLLKATGSPIVYMVSGNSLVPLASLEQLRSYGFTLAQIKEVSPEEIKKYTIKN